MSSRDVQETLTDGELIEFRNASKLYEEKEGKMDKFLVNSTLKSLGQKLSEGELDKAFATISADGEGTIEFSSFLKMVKSRNKQKTNEEELKEAFNILDEGGRGMVMANELKEVLVGLGGEKGEEVEAMLKDISDSQGMVNYDSFVSMVSRIMK